ncbi:unnamed protein product [Adineta steineri]|uniref:Protein NO VEIN C-terminal domain-containing protein n=1 Tax=Adineta steineri TaxID=433720 RepID=A0A815CFR3_9BILA|nr:unnamed protein product [Adineta steineri]
MPNKTNLAAFTTQFDVAVKPLVSYFNRNQINLKVVNGKIDVVNSFMEIYQKPITASTTLLLHTIDTLQNIELVQNSILTLATTQDLPILTVWLKNFQIDAGLFPLKPDEEIRAVTEDKITKKTLYKLVLNGDQQLVSMLAIVRETEKFAVISWVYTPPDSRIVTTKHIIIMNRNNRFSNNRKNQRPSKNEPVKTVASVPENFTYVDQDFPSLSAASTVTTKVDPKLSTEDKSVKTTSREPSTTRPLENVKPEPAIPIKKQHSPWKKPSESLQPVSLLAFMPQSVTKQDLTTNHHSITHNPVAQSETRSMTTYEDEIDTKLCEIILTIHQLHEYVSLERVEKELFEHYKVNSFRELRVNARHLKTLTNLSHRIKDVTFYMQIFEQIFNLCTLHDLDPLLAKFLKFDTYEEAHLGPLDKNPDVQRVFQYKPRKRHQSIPDITSGQIIDAFIAFKDKHRRHERYNYNEFIAELLQQNQLHKKEELGIYCKSFPYLSEISGKVTQDYKKYTKRVETDAQKQIIRTVETRLWEIQREVSSELNLSAYIDKLPIAVFDHLVSIVDKHLTVTQQKLVRDTLMDIRDNELLRCLLNISIYLGTIDQPEEFIAELKKLIQHQKKESERQDSTALSSSHVTTKSMNSKNQRKEQQYMDDIQNSDTTTDLTRPSIETSFGNSSSLIIYEYVQVNRMPLNIYRQVMTTWFIGLRSSAQLQRDQKEPMQYILEFLTYLPTLIGQSRIVQELILDPLDEVFSNNEDSDELNPRERIWMLADRKQKSKLEAWAYLLDIDEWKNENKWKGIEEIDIEQPNHNIQDKQTYTQDIVVPTKVQPDPLSTIPSSPVAVIERLIPINNNTNINDPRSCSAAYEHIKKIREGFGDDSSLDAASQSIVNNLKGVLKRSLEKLSNDLYSDQGHFVLELIQNADDNHYSSDCLPTLRFIVSSDRILVCNNEIGFQPDNVTAICNVGKSTKGKHKQGYTGHKGIGFKSVFMVSHRPEIHSGDYHFCFDTDLGKEQIGYIRPIWLEQSEELLPSTSDWTTCIRLPIKMEERGFGLKRNFDDIHARLLLFLNRLRQIEIVREKDNHEINTRIFTRIDHANGQIIELQERTTTSENILRSFWLVVKTTSEIPLNIKRQLNDVKGDIQSTIIAIAYPLDAIHESSSYAILPSQPLFAYLPLRSYGFRFILQGDFEIPATRQEVLRDNIWNEWLKKEMIQLLPTAYDLFKNLPKLLTTCSIDVQKHIGLLDSMETLKYFIKMLPTQNDLDPYFNSFIDKAIKGLMGCIQLPIISEKDQDNIQWVSPTQCVFVRDSFIRQIFTSDLLLSHFNNYYLNEQFVNECDENILIKLGCRRLDFSTILKLIKTLYTQNDQEYSTKTTTIEQIAQWFLCIDYSFQQERDQPDFNYNDNDQNEITTMDQLKQMKIIPLQQQTRLVSIEEMKDKAIFFPLDKSTEFAKYLKLVAEGLPTIDERLMEYIEKKYPRRLNSIKDLLKKLDLYSLNPAEFANDMKKLRTQLIIKTQQGNFIRINSNETDIVHLTSFYGSQTSLDLLKLFPNRFQFISNDYLTEYQKGLFYHAKERLKFNYFLYELDLHGFFLIKKKDQGFINVEQLVNTQWSSEIQTLSSLIFEPFIIEDNCSDELDTLIMSKDSLNANQYFEILRYLDYTFKFFGSYYASSVIRSRDRHTGETAPVHGVASSLCLSLRKHSWIPVSDGQLYKPSDVYYLPINNPFRRYVPCLDPSVVRLSDMNFVQILGFKQEISHMTMFELLMKWSCNLNSDMLWKLINMTDEQDSNPIPCTISTQPRQLYHDTLQNIQNIYLFISMDEEIRRLLARFRQWPLIFIPRTDDIGEFVFVDEVFWEDPLTLLPTIDVNTRTSNQHIALQPYYNNNKLFQQFFFDILQIKQGPTLDDYLLLLSDIKNKTFDYIWKCINVITQLAFTDNKQTLVKDTTIDWSFIPCINNGNELVKYTDRPYYPHDMIVADLFSDIIRIINLPDNLIHSIEFKQQFCTLFNIDSLANVLKVLVNVDNKQPARELHEFYSHSIELIQYYLIINGLLPETRSCYLQSIFSKMNFLLVDCIHLSYQYGENLIRKAPLPSALNSYIDESTSNFYILHKYAKNENYHIDTIVDYLMEDVSARLQLSQFIQKLYKSYEQHGVEHLIKQREVLPDHNIPKWMIPQIMKSELHSSSIKEEEKEEEDEGNDEIITYTLEMLQKLKEEPCWQPKKPTTKPILDPDQTKPLICIPSTAGATLSNEALDKEHSAKSGLQLTDVVRERATSANVHESSEQTIPRDKEKHTNGKNKDIQHYPSKTTTIDKTFEGSTVSHINSVTLADFTPPQPSINFELIQISNFTDIALIPTTLSDQALPTNLNLPNNETDSIIGRRGEDFVYRYLLWKHPDAQIQWNNQQKESGQPFDIKLIRNENKKQIEFIEVKTTRVPKQNTFQISIGEIECLLQNQNNYYIYRVYYNDEDEKSSTITILSRIKCHLQQKQLTLSITIAEKLDEQ